jgi:hypothetical protein
MATKGRGGDSMLVHMTPEEVQSLQAMALKGGGSLTINPDTGLPEANFLKKMLPMIAGAALNFFAPGVGTAVGSMFGLGAAAGTGIAVGGITSLATGSLSRGLMAGLGAYGGASLAGGLANAGTGALSAEAGNAALTNAGLTGDAALTSAADDVAQRAISERLASATPFETLKAGASAVTDSASAMGNFAKNNWQAGLAAISPIMADQGVQTATKMPSTGTIRNYTFDPYGQTYTSAGNYPASEYKGMAQGGIVALAGGGQSYIDLNKDSSADQIASAYKAFTDASGGDTKDNQNAAIKYLENLGIGTPMIEQAYGKFQAGPTYTNYTAQNVTDYLQANPNVDIATAIQQTNADPRTVNQAISQLGAGFLDPTQTGRGSGSMQYYDAFSKYGIDANELFAANQFLNPGYSFAGDATTGALSRAFETAKDFKGFDPQGATQGLKDVEWVKKMDLEGATALDIARLTGLSIGEVQAREAAARLLMQTKIGTGNLGTVDILPGGGLGVSGGGNTVVNPNGTITTTPNIPGRPEGGFTGMGQVKDVYTQGGGSLGYTNRAPKDMDEFNERFGKQTGDSLAAYEYLMGKGANNNAYPTKSGVAQIMRPYSEVTTGIPAAEGRPSQKYIFQDGKYVENPNYRPLSYDSKGNRTVGMTSAEVLKGIKGLKDPADDGALFDWVTSNNISEAQLAAALGISIAEARARIAAGKKKSTGSNTNTSTGETTRESYGGEGTSSGGGGAGANANAPGGGNAAGGAGNSGDGGTGDSSTAVAKRGGVMRMALGGLGALAGGGSTAQYNLGGYSDGGRLLRGPGDGVSDSIPATIGNKQPARLADGEFVVPARIVSELGNGSTEAGARKLYAMMDRVQKARGKTTGKRRVAANTRSEKYLPA